MERFRIMPSFRQWGLIAGAITAIMVSRKIRRRRRMMFDPETLEYKSVSHVKNLYMYPLDMGRRCEINEGNCTKVGLCTTINGFRWRDRSFIIFEANDLVCTPYIPNMSKISILPLETTEIKLCSTDDAVGITISRPELRDRRKISVRAGGCTQMFPCWDLGDKASDWISRYLTPENRFRLRIGYLDEETKLLIQTKDMAMDSTQVTKFSELNSLSLLSETSVADANELRLHRVNENFFRPNIFIEPLEFSETGFEWIKIGEAIFKAEKLQICKRRVADPQTGELLILSPAFMRYIEMKSLNYRKYIPSMGIHLSVHTPGKIRVGDVVQVTYRSNKYDWLLRLLPTNRKTTTRRG